MTERADESVPGSVPSALRTVAKRYLSVVRRYGRFPFGLPLAALLLFGPAVLAFESALLWRVGIAFGGLPATPPAVVGVVAALLFYWAEDALVRRLAARID